ncbi:MAG: sugar phosphate isomerase/epimerase [bacterium]|nr:sugar phosphate isomerase/epimerase [bacterium]
MKNIAISNIAWLQSEDDKMFEIMANLKVSLLEISPFRESADKKVINNESAKNLKMRLYNYGIKIVSLQALLYRFPELVIFQGKVTRAKTLNHLERVIDFACEVGAKSLIFGSPKNKLRGKLDYDNAFTIAIDFFGKLAERAKLQQVSLCIEPTPTVYGSDFIRDTNETVALLKAVNSSALRLNLDIGSSIVNKENIEDIIQNNIQYIGNVHISEPFLKMITFNSLFHQRIADKLNANSYNNNVSLEMLPQTNKNVNGIYRTLIFIQKIYSNYEKNIRS